MTLSGSQIQAGSPTPGVMECGDYTIVNRAKKRINAYQLSSLELRFDNKGTIEKRQLCHFWYDTWPDHGAPEQTEGVTDMLQAVGRYSVGGPSQPWVVHCSAGIGRTGTFIGTDIGMHLIDTCGHANVREIIQQMREDRGGTVQTPVQAEFIYAAVSRYAHTFNQKHGLATDDSAETTIKTPTPGPVEVYDPKLKKKRTVDTKDYATRVTVEGFDGPGMICFTGHHATDFEIGNCVGVVFDTAIGDMNGVAAGHRYFECVDGYGSLVSSEDVAIEYEEFRGVLSFDLERTDPQSDYGIKLGGAETSEDGSRVGYGVFVDTVVPDSIADVAGLKHGMQVLHVNMTSCAKATQAETTALMNGSPTRCSLDVRENCDLVATYAQRVVETEPTSDGDSEYDSDESIDGMFLNNEAIVTAPTRAARVYVTGDPLWLHEPTGRDTTDTLLAKDGRKDGHFMVRKRYDEKSFSLAVVLRGEITHHLIVEDEETGDLAFDGDWARQPVVGCTTLNDLMRSLADPTLDKQLWPQVLTHFIGKNVRVDSKTGPYSAPFRFRAKAAPKRAAAAKATKDEKEEAAKDVKDATPALKTVQVWTGISRDDAEGMLMQAGPNEGAWLIRTTLRVGSYDLCVVAKGELVHHLLEQEKDKSFKLNRRAYGEGKLTTIDAVIGELSTNPPEVWPTTLDRAAQYTAMPFRVGETVSAPFSEDGKNYDGIIVDMLMGEGTEESVARVSWVGHLSDFDDLVPISSLQKATGQTNPFFYLVGKPVDEMREDANMSAKQLVDAKAERLKIMHAARSSASLTFKLLAERLRSNADDFGLKVENKGFGNFIANVGKVALDFHGYGGKLSPGMRIMLINGKDVEKVSGKECRLILKEVIAALVRRNRLNGPYVVDISKEDIAANGGKVGLRFASVQNEYGNYITAARGAAGKSGLLKEGLKIASINGQDVTNVSKDVVTTLLTSGEALRIVAAEDLEGYARLLESHPQSHVIVRTVVTEEAIAMNGGKIGMSFVNAPTGVFVTKATGAAEQAGLSEGHQLLMINGTNVATSTKAECMALLKSSPTIELTSKQDPLGYFVVNLAKEQKQKAKLMAELPKEVELVVRLDTEGYRQHVEYKQDKVAATGGGDAASSAKAKKKKKSKGEKKPASGKAPAAKAKAPKAKVLQATVTAASVTQNGGKIGVGLVTLEDKVYLKKVGGAAEVSGLQVGQQLLKINDTDIKGLSSKVRHAPVVTPVRPFAISCLVE